MPLDDLALADLEVERGGAFVACVCVFRLARNIHQWYYGSLAYPLGRDLKKRTGIKLLPVGLEGAAVVNRDLVALLGLALALDLARDLNFELVGGGGRGGEDRNGGEDGGSLHGCGVCLF